MQLFRVFKVTALLFGLLASVLTGCGSQEPSSADIDKMIRDQVVGTKSIVVHEVRKIGCVRAKNAPGFICDIEVDATAPQFFGTPTRNKKVMKLRIFPDGNDWKSSTEL
jgi:hypothetical protein